MAVKLSDLRLYGSAVMADNDTTLNIGGAIGTSKKVEFADLAGQVQVVSSAAGDTTQSVTVHYRTAAGAVTSESQTLNGLTPVLYALTAERLLKAIKSATTTGDVAVEAQSATRTGTAQGGDADRIQLDTGASGVDNFYRSMIVRLTAGTGSGQIRQVVAYNGTSKQALISSAWGTIPDATSVFRLSKGFFLDKSPHEIFEARRIFYQAAADTPIGNTRFFYEKIFFKNGNGASSLTDATVVEVTDPNVNIAFGLDSVVDGTSSNGAANNRQVAPSGITFASTPVLVPGGGILAAGVTIGVWLRLSLGSGASSSNTIYVPKLQGQAA